MGGREKQQSIVLPTPVEKKFKNRRFDPWYKIMLRDLQFYSRIVTGLTSVTLERTFTDKQKK